MTLPDRAAQLVMVGVPADSEQVPPVVDRAVRGLGVQGVILTGRTTATRDEVRSLTDRLQRLASESAAGAGLEVSVDQEGGQVQALSGAGFSAIPSALDQGRLRHPALRRSARGWGAELAAAGVTLDLAPVADAVPVGRDNAPIGAYDREYGHTPAAAAADVPAVVGGLRAAGVAATLKHFPGLGRVSGNTDTTAGVTDPLTTRHDRFLRPFAAGIDAGAPYVMVSTATYLRIDGARVAAFSRTIIGGMLRRQLHFDGVVISDDLGLAQAVATVPVGQRAVLFVAAGGDVALTVVPEQAGAMVDALVARARAAPPFRQVVAAAATRVLVRKARAGLVSCG